MPAAQNDRATPRDRLLRAALELLTEGGTEAASTRAVIARAGVQAPAIYRLFGDMPGLLAAAAEQGFADWVARKGRRADQADSTSDPVEALRAGWDDAVAFGLENPALYRIVNARRPASPSPSRDEGFDLLRAKIERTARAGRLSVPVDRAAALMHATAHGVTLTLLDTPADQRDPSLSDLAREAVVAAITVAPAPDAPSGLTLVSAAVALRSHLGDDSSLSPTERALLGDWLRRIAGD